MIRLWNISIDQVVFNSGEKAVPEEEDQESATTKEATSKSANSKKGSLSKKWAGHLEIPGSSPATKSKSPNGTSHPFV